MANVRRRPETGCLFLDFRYRGVRCREQTTLQDTAANRRTLETFANRIKREMAQPVIIDLRNVYRPEDMVALGFVYESVGRVPVRG